MPEVKPMSRAEIALFVETIGQLPADNYLRRLLATNDSKDREIEALRGLIDTLSFCYDQPVSDLALMVNANKERDRREAP